MNELQSRPCVTIAMAGSHGQNRFGGGTVSNCFQFTPWLVRNVDELLQACLESQHIEP